ncbi:MAG TPA: alpha/beta hydrolase [Candidatus Binataceae bacterium]|nr:alpha/beta hydrolase [Candidatus Binataceae bacterium]
MPDDGFVNANGLRLHYRDYGGAGNPVVLFLHGLTGNGYCFDHVAPRFTTTHHALALDLRGHGDSEWESAGNYSFRDHLNDLFAFLAALNITRLSLVGSSLGGALAMIAAAVRPELAERVVLNDQGPEFNGPGLAEAAKRPSTLANEFRSLGELLEIYRSSYPPARNLPDDLATEYLRNSTRLGDNGLLRWKTDPRVQSIAPPVSTNENPPVDMWRFFDQIKAPVLVVRGAESDILIPGTVAKMCSRGPHVRAVEVPGVGHTPWLSEPEALAALHEFLHRQ